MRVHIEFDDGTTPVANVANLTGSSVFVRTEATPSFQTPVVIRLGEIVLRGTVALVAREPRGFVAVFDVPIDQRMAFGALLDQVEVLTDTAWVEHTQPNPEPPEEVRLSALAADLVAQTPEILVPDAPAPSPWLPPAPRALPMLPDPPPPPAPRAASGAHGGARMSLPRPGSGVGSGGTVRAALARPNSGSGFPSASGLPTPMAPSRPTPPPPAVTPPPAALPELSPDDTLVFRSGPDYAAHYRTHIAFGGVIARAAPRAIGSMHSLTVVVPGAGPPLSLRARVGFVGDGTVGLMIDSFPIEKPQLESLLAHVAAS